MKKYVTILCSILLLYVTSVTAQKLIPFQYQSQSKWDYNAKWGFMNENRKIIKEPVSYNIAQQAITAPYFYNGYKIIETKSWKTVWDSIETLGIKEIKGNIVSFKNPLRGTYQSYNFKNIATKKLIAAEGEFSSVINYVIFEEAVEGSYGNKKGLKDENGKIIIPAKYEKIENKGYNFFTAKNDEGYFIFNKEGKVLNTEPYSDIKNNIYGDPEKVLTVAVRKTKSTATKKFILLTPSGKELPQYFYNKTGNNPFPFDAYGNRLTAKKNFYTDGDFYTNELCTPENKVSIGTILNEKGEMILNNSGYTNPKFLSEFLIQADYTDNKRYLLNVKGERAADFTIGNADVVTVNSNQNFLIHTNLKLRKISRLLFYDYDYKIGRVKIAKKEVELEDSLEIESVGSAYGKYYLVKVKDFKKQQYVTYIYDNTAKLVLKSEDGLWMYRNDCLIKYGLNSKKEEMYIGYYDENLKPYSIIKE
jgi:hypothetical protein